MCQPLNLPFGRRKIGVRGTYTLSSPIDEATVKPPKWVFSAAAINLNQGMVIKFITAIGVDWVLVGVNALVTSTFRTCVRFLFGYIKSLTWIQVGVEAPIARLAHTRTQVGSDLGGHDGEDYTSEVKSFNLVTLQWEPRTVKGQFPPRIGYHTATLHDSRLIIIGGFDGRHVYDQVWCLELASLA
ncbi:hypothetical protein Pst134EB_006050 [Puccinia striiformis f. sp. tritici]|nr:hypothetical protein Pst134EB_006050 [Puccinia striiformis f. sp. tritici]